MKIHEYQGKELLKKFNVPVPRGIVARSPEEAYQAAKELATTPVVVKAQIHAGGRGKGGGVKLAKTADEARELARQMLGMKLVTHQTGPEGREVRVLLIEEGLPIDKEFYLGIVLDRASGRPDRSGRRLSTVSSAQTRVCAWAAERLDLASGEIHAVALYRL